MLSVSVTSPPTTRTAPNWQMLALSAFAVSTSIATKVPDGASSNGLAFPEGGRESTPGPLPRGVFAPAGEPRQQWFSCSFPSGFAAWVLPEARFGARQAICKWLINMVGALRFELRTSCSQSRRATRLRYAPKGRPGMIAAGIV